MAITISIVSFRSSCTLEYDSNNAIMSAFPIMVTILIGIVTMFIASNIHAFVTENKHEG